jgi:hypothetical protein
MIDQPAGVPFGTATGFSASSDVGGAAPRLHNDYV